MRVLKVLLYINAAMFVVELVAGIYADSAGVLADSLDMLADAIVYGVSLYAVGRCDATKRRAARLGGYAQLLLAVGIAAELVRKLVFGSEPQSVVMFSVSFLALIANALCLRLLSNHREGGVHMKASWIFTRTDVIANAGVIIAALLVGILGSPWPDLLVGAAILAVVVHGGILILRESRAPVAGKT